MLALVACTSPESPDLEEDTASDADTGSTGTADSSDEGSTGSQDDGTDTETDTGDTDSGDPPYPGETQYPSDLVHSPISVSVRERMTQILEMGSGQLDVFAQAGASGTATPSSLRCFEDTGPIEGYPQLESLRQFFLGGDAGGENPFARVTKAARPGARVSWVLTGDPAPLDEELADTSPAYLFVRYGTNEIVFTADPFDYVETFFRDMQELMVRTESAGAIPIVHTIPWLAMGTPVYEVPNRWVRSYNSVLRLLAQSHQTPLLNLHVAYEPLPDHGLAGPTNIHLSSFPEGACVVSDEALEYGYNLRNFLNLESALRIGDALDADDDQLDEAVPMPPGDGSLDMPYVIEQAWMPFVDFKDTRDGESIVDSYECAPDTDESGPEIWYRFVLDEPTALRIFVLTLTEEVDVDVHLLRVEGAQSTCVARGHRRIEGTLSAGEYAISVDSWVDGGVALAGEFGMVVIDCEADDPACTQPLD